MGPRKGKGTNVLKIVVSITRQKSVKSGEVLPRGGKLRFAEIQKSPTIFPIVFSHVEAQENAPARRVELWIFDLRRDIKICQNHSIRTQSTSSSE